jgi:hypothetical protein
MIKNQVILFALVQDALRKKTRVIQKITLFQISVLIMTSLLLKVTSKMLKLLTVNGTCQSQTMLLKYSWKVILFVLHLVAKNQRLSQRMFTL